MGTNLLFSIIIPVYQVEDYLAACMDTVLPLKQSDCEIILVIGNSIDRSNEIAMEYAQKYKGVRIVKQSGTGLSNARNCGVSNSDGAFIVYIDSDDLVDTSKLLMLMKHIRESRTRADVYMSDYIQLFPSGKKRSSCQVGDMSAYAGMAALPVVLREKKCFWNVWRYIYRRAFLEKHQISFWENRTSEDVDYTAKVFSCNPQIEFWNKPYYLYRMGRKDSLMNVVSVKRVQDVTTVLESSIAMLGKANGFAYAQVLQEQFRFEYLLNIALICEVGKKDRHDAYTAFANWKSVLHASKSVIVKTFYFFMLFFGLSSGARILLGLKKVKRKIVRH